MTVITSCIDTKITANSQWRGKKRRKIEEGMGGREGTLGRHGEGQGGALLFKVFTRTHNVQKWSRVKWEFRLGGQQRESAFSGSFHFQRGEWLLCLDKITSKDLLWSTGSSAQHYGARTCKRVDTSMWIPESPRCTPETNTMLPTSCVPV